MSFSAPLPVSFYSVVVKRRSVARRFSGGAAAFDRQLPAARGDAELVILVAMSLADANYLSTKLYNGGLVPEEDFGLVSMHEGPLVPCEGIKVTEGPAKAFGLPPEFFVQYVHGYRPVRSGADWRWTDRDAGVREGGESSGLPEDGTKAALEEPNRAAELDGRSPYPERAGRSGANKGQPPAAAPRINKVPQGLTAHQYYQWRSLHSPEDDE